MSKYQVTVPTHLDEIPLEKLLQWETEKNTDDVEALTYALTLFCDVSYSDVKKIPYKPLMEIAELLKATLNNVPDHKPRFTMNGVEYGFVPNLDDMTFGEFVDLDKYLKDPLDHWKVMSILFRPVTQTGQGGKYLIEPYSGKVPEDFQKMPSGIAIGARVFFWTLGVDLLSEIQRYLKSQIRRKKKKLQLPSNTLLTKNGGGLDSFTSSLKETLHTWTQLRDFPSSRLSCGALTKATWQKYRNGKYKQAQQQTKKVA